MAQNTVALTEAEKKLNDLWELHMKTEFDTKNVDDTMLTMARDELTPHVNHVPVLTGGCGLQNIKFFYSKYFIPQMPPETKITMISRTIGRDRLVDEQIFEFKHTVPMAWMLPGIKPTGKTVRVPLVVIIHFAEDKVVSEHIYWDQASVLAQLGLIEVGDLPITKDEQAQKILDPTIDGLTLIKKAEARESTDSN